MHHTPDTAAIEAYRQQMMEMFRQSTPSPTVIPTEDNWLDSRYPEPDIQRDTEAIAPSPAMPDADPKPQTQPTPPPGTAAFVGYRRVFAFTGGGAEPIEGAQVIVTQPTEDTPTIHANLTTDRDGFTPIIALPSVDPALTLRPGVAQPYVTYAVRVTADGFQPVEHRNIPVYGDNYVTQPVAMTPILPGKDADNTQEFTSGGPTNL